MYEILKRFQFQNEKVFYIDELKSLLGIESNKYKRYFDFKKDVIERVKKELADYMILREMNIYF